MRFLLDENVPKDVATALREEGHDVVRAQGTGLESASDDVIWHYAAVERRVLVTADLDFPLGGEAPNGLILLRRFDRVSASLLAMAVLNSIRSNLEDIEGHITVVAPGQVRRRRL
jgi:predicted nuclease of predicted toxin-antitoxin system